MKQKSAAAQQINLHSLFIKGMRNNKGKKLSFCHCRPRRQEMVLQPLRSGPEWKTLPRTKRLGLSGCPAVCLSARPRLPELQAGCKQRRRPGPLLAVGNQKGQTTEARLSSARPMFAKEGAFPWRGPRHATGLLLFYKGWRGREIRVCPKVANRVRGERVYLQDSVRLGPGCGDGRARRVRDPRGPRFPRAWRHPAEARGTPALSTRAPRRRGGQPGTETPGTFLDGWRVTLIDGSRKPCLAFPAHPSHQQGHRGPPGRDSVCPEPRDEKRFPLKCEPPTEMRSGGRALEPGVRWPCAASTGQSPRGGRHDQAA